MIENEMEKKKITKTCIAKHTNVSPAMVTKWFKGENLINLNMFLKIIKLVFGREDRDLIKRYMMTCDKKFDIEVMEWCYSNGEMELLDLALNRGAKKENSEIKTVYSLLKRRRLGQITAECFYNEVDLMKMKMNVSSPHLHILMIICSSYAYEGLDVYRPMLMMGISEETLKILDEIKSDYLKESYRLRLYENYINSRIKSKDLKSALDLADKVLNDDIKYQFPTQYASICCSKAQALTFTNYKESVRYYKEILEMFEGVLKVDESRRSLYSSGHDFVKIVNKDFKGLYLDDKEEYAHFLASQDDPLHREQAVEIIDELIEECGKEDMYHKYYKALAKRDRKLMEEAEREFLICGDLFYAELPRRHLDKIDL
jgi:transcriptional regulator with XRE-family HTH domain